MKQVNYYRFSAYCLPFEVTRHQFKPNVTFNQIAELYEFDRRLRFLVEEFPKLPIWVAVEIMSFSSISLLIANLKRIDQEILAKKLELNTTLLISWLHTFAYIRNICAHHARLWDRKLSIAIRLPNKDYRWNNVNTARLGAALLAINQFLFKLPVVRLIIEEWRKEIEVLFDKEMEVENFWGRMGLSGKLQAHPLWGDVKK